MCNDYRLMVELASVIKEFEHLKIKIRFPEGRPNIEACEDIKITDTAPIVRAIEGERGAGALVQRRWSWPSPTRKPLYNFRSEGREFTSNRCLIVADGFYEFTAPADPTKKRKDKVAVPQDRRANLCHCRHLARDRGRRRGVHHADDGTGAGHRSLSRPSDRHSRTEELG